MMAALLCALGRPVAADEMRAVWVDAWHSGCINASQVTTLVNNCKTYNFNTVVVQMRRRGDAWYMPTAPNLEPRTTAISSSFDALQEVINQCHAANPPIQVHVWTPAHLIWSTESTPPSQASHVYNLHPEYLMKNYAGATWIGEGYYIDPGNPGATQWNFNMALDIVSHYDIDAYHWDYIRYPQQDSGYNDVAIARYNAEFGLSGKPTASDSQFSSWRRRQITDFLRWVNSEILAVKPEIAIGCSVFANRYDAYTYRFQDWAAWNTEGSIDLCFPMNYTATNSTFNSRVDDAYANQGCRWVIMGPGAYLNTKENTVVQLNYCRNTPLNGTCLYSYAVPNSGTVDQAGTFSYIKTNYQPTYESVPLLPWKATPTKGIIKGTITKQGTGEALYNATVTLLSSPQRVQKTEPHGKYAFFETSPGTYSVSATASGLGTITGSVTVTAGQVSNLNLVVPTSDTTPPTISGVTSSNITDSSARITWTTDENSDSVVEYGLTTSYGSTASNSSLVTNHTINLAGLSASTTYHYRVKSKDAANNQATSGDYTFTTNASGVVSDIIIDNTSAVITGTWSTGTSATDKYGTDYKYKSQGTGAAYATYTPNILTAGNYYVYEWHPQGTNRTTGAPHVITYSGGTATVNVNQQVNGGAWNLLGTYYFAVGTAGKVKITDAIPTSGFVVMADAIKFAYASPSAPTAPSGLAATAAGSSQVNLSWTDNSSNESSFVVGRSTTSGGPYTDVATLAANTTSYSDSGLSPSTTYYYVVRAANAGGSSANSNQASATTTVAAPAAPSNLTATAISSSQINLAWTDNATNETNYVVARAATSGGPYTDIATLGAGVTSYSNTGLTANTTYYYVVRATNAGGASANSNEASTMTLPTPPAAPSGLTATAASQTQVNLAWTDNASNEDNVIVARGTASGGPYTDIATLDADAASYSDTGLTAGTTYYYVVRAVNTGGASANSNQASATTLPNAPAAPSGLTATAASASQINLAWTDNSSNETNFVVARSTTSGGPYTDIATLGAGVTSYSNTGLTASTTYYYVVRATNAGGASANSNQANATTLPSPPAAPSGLTATAVSTSQINLAWTDNSTNETNFVVARSATSGGPYTDIATLAANTTSYSNTGLAAGTTYYYVVRATNAGGASANSAQAGATTIPNPPAAPSGLTATAASSSQINLAWTDNSSNESNFVVARSTTSGGPYTDIATLAANTTSYNNTGLSAATTYYYVVRATNAGGASANSSQASATTLPNPPTAPSGLTATAVSSSQINLAWTDNSSNESNFILARSTVNGGPYTDIATLGANVTSYSNTGLASGTTYYYVVRATNAGGASANSNQASATTNSSLPDIIVDNVNATFTGTWTVSTASTELYGTNYKWANSGSGATATFNANVPQAGNYSVKVWYPSGTNRADNAPYTVNFSGGSLTYPVNQQVTGGQWVTLGTHYFAAGGGQVVIGTTGANPSVVIADAVRFTYLNATAPVTITLDSVAADDGHVFESGENTNVGGTVNSSNTTFAVGDYSDRRQLKGFVSFDTSSIPDTATIQKVTLKVTRYSVTGADPYLVLGTLNLDIKSPYFGAAATLAAEDFAAAAGATAVATVPRPTSNNTQVSAALNSTGVLQTNKTGKTQLKLSFSTDDDNDSANDYMNFYSGNYTTNTARRPKLEVQYTQ